MDLSGVVEELKDNYGYKLDRIKMFLRLLGPQDWSAIDKYFIVSTGRTGTKFFARFLNQFTDVYSIHEPSPDFLQLALNYAQGNVTLKEAAEKIRYYRRAVGKEVNRQGSKKYIESNNRFFSLLAPLEEAFSEFKVVHIVRDGRDYVRSGMSRAWYEAGDPDPRLKASLFPADPHCEEWSNMNRFEKICWRWQKKDGFIWDWVQEADNAITVKFEDIFKTDHYRGVYKIAEYIGLPKQKTEQMIEEMLNRKINSTKSYAIPHWTDWDQKRMKVFNQIAGEHMKNYNYYES